jgi:hypothetical protein
MMPDLGVYYPFHEGLSADSGNHYCLYVSMISLFEFYVV